MKDRPPRKEQNTYYDLTGATPPMRIRGRALGTLAILFLLWLAVMLLPLLFGE